MNEDAKKQWGNFGVATGSSLLSTGLGLLTQNLSNRNTYKWGEKAAESDFARQMQLYERQYKDKSPLNVVNQLKEAGLNKGLMFSGGASGVGGAASGTTAGTNKMGGAQLQQQQNLAVTMAQIENMKAQTELTKEQAENLRQGRPNISLEGENIKSTTELNVAKAEGEKLNNQLKSGTLDANIEQAYASLEQTWANYKNILSDTNKNESEIKTIENIRDAQVAETLSRIAINKANVKLTESETKQVTEQIKTIIPYLDQLKKQVENGTTTAEAAKSQAETRAEQLEWDKMTFGVKTIVEAAGNILGNFVQFANRPKGKITRTTNVGDGNTIKSEQFHYGK